MRRTSGKDVSFQCRERVPGNRSERREAGTCSIRFGNMPHSDFGNMRRSSQWPGLIRGAEAVEFVYRHRRGGRYDSLSKPWGCLAVLLVRIRLASSGESGQLPTRVATRRRTSGASASATQR